MSEPEREAPEFTAEERDALEGVAIFFDVPVAEVIQTVVEVLEDEA